MKSKLIALGALGCLSILNLQITRCQAQGTAFTYQGRLNDGAGPANGRYDLTFSLFSSSTGGSPLPSPQTNSAVAISNGLFSVTISSLVGGVFNGTTYWLEIGVRTNGAAGFATLASRQQITPTPYAIFAEGANAAGLSGTLPATSFSGTYGAAVALNNAGNSFGGTFTGNGANVTNVNAAALNGLTASSFWQLGGNAGSTPETQFMGTTDNEALNIKVNNTTALQITPGVTLPNVVGGLGAFRPSVIASNVSGAVIAGGNAPSGGVTGFGGGDFHAVYDNDGVVGGGFGNKVGSNNGDPTDAAFATVAGGVFNGASGYAATVAGGDGNTAGGGRSAVGGGFGNLAAGDFSAVGGGQSNGIQTNSDHSTVAGGYGNLIQPAAAIATIGGGVSNVVQTFAYSATISGGARNTAGAQYAVVGGGALNVNNGEEGVVSGGEFNDNESISGVIGGGGSNTNLPGPLGGGGTIGGGELNLVTNDFATIPGGLGNVAGGFLSFAAGYQAQALHDGAFVWADSQNAVFTSTTTDEFSIRAGGGMRVCGVSGKTLVSINPNGQLTASGTTGNGVEGHSTSLAASGVYGQSDGGGYGVAGRTTGTGSAIYGDNPSASGWAGDFNGKVRCVSLTQTSDRNAKQDLRPVNARSVLDKVAALPISEWKFKTDPATPHLGPMAQDFYAAFGLGEDDRHITTVDEEGVALAAIQGLNQKLDEKDGEIQTLKQQNDALGARLLELEAAIKSLAARK